MVAPLSELPQYVTTVGNQLSDMHTRHKNYPAFLKEWARVRYNIADLTDSRDKVLSSEEEHKELIQKAHRTPAFESYLSKKIRGLEFTASLRRMIEIDTDITVVQLFLQQKEREVEALRIEALALYEHDERLRELYSNGADPDKIRAALEQQQEALRELYATQIKNLEREIRELENEIKRLKARNAELGEFIKEHKQKAADLRAEAGVLRQEAAVHRQNAANIIHKVFEEAKTNRVDEITIKWPKEALDAFDKLGLSPAKLLLEHNAVFEDMGKMKAAEASTWKDRFADINIQEVAATAFQRQIEKHLAPLPADIKSELISEIMKMNEVQTAISDVTPNVAKAKVNAENQAKPELVTAVKKEDRAVTNETDAKKEDTLVVTAEIEQNQGERKSVKLEEAKGDKEVILVDVQAKAEKLTGENKAKIGAWEQEVSHEEDQDHSTKIKRSFILGRPRDDGISRFSGRNTTRRCYSSLGDRSSSASWLELRVLSSGSDLLSHIMFILCICHYCFILWNHSIVREIHIRSNFTLTHPPNQSSAIQFKLFKQLSGPVVKFQSFNLFRCFFQRRRNFSWCR